MFRPALITHAHDSIQRILVSRITTYNEAISHREDLGLSASSTMNITHQKFLAYPSSHDLTNPAWYQAFVQTNNIYICAKFKFASIFTSHKGCQNIQCGYCQYNKSLLKSVFTGSSSYHSSYTDQCFRLRRGILCGERAGGCRHLYFWYPTSGRLYPVLDHCCINFW